MYPGKPKTKDRKKTNEDITFQKVQIKPREWRQKILAQYHCFPVPIGPPANIINRGIILAAENTRKDINGDEYYINNLLRLDTKWKDRLEQCSLSLWGTQSLEPMLLKLFIKFYINIRFGHLDKYLFLKKTPKFE